MEMGKRRSINTTTHCQDVSLACSRTQRRCELLSVGAVRRSVMFRER